MPRKRTGAKWLDVSERPLVLMEGPDGKDLLQRIATNDMRNLRPGRPVQTVFANEKGRIVDAAAVIELDDTHLLLAGISEEEGLLRQWIDKFVIMEDVRVSSVSGHYKHIVVYQGTLPVDGSAGTFEFKERWGGQELQHFCIPRSSWESFGKVLDEEAVESDTQSFERFRIRSGIPAWPSELSDRYNPLEAGLNSLISWTKGCYIGQEVIARLDTYKKVQKKLLSFECSDVPAIVPASLRSGENEDGILTSVENGENERPLAGLGYVRMGISAGHEFRITEGTREIRVIVKGAPWKHL